MAVLLEFHRPIAAAKASAAIAKSAARRYR